MLVIEDALGASDLPRGAVVSIGNYDGLHRGQQAVLARVVERARALGTTSAVVTFDPHPFAILRPEGAPPRLLTAGQKERFLAELGIDALLVVRFTREVAAWPARRFVDEFLAAALGVREVYVGESFAFGRQREGNLGLLRELGLTHGFVADAVPEVTWRGERVSASRIREAIARGAVDDARQLLGRPYAITGVVARGDRMGKKLGWPTINVVPDHAIVPAEGVYACRVKVATFPSSFACATNIGTRPTVYERFSRVVEGHILDFHADVYGERVELEFYRRLRDERVFPTVMDLAAQIGRDVEATRELFARERQREETNRESGAVEVQGLQLDPPGALG